ncbi:MAG: glycosyltransferase family 4 protein [Deltaproteobacteria bacterium]|nr:glycosyltransferase family 4 protein [Deltaproteobacteria bacterium]
MDLVGNMLLENLQRHHSSALRAVKIRPRFVRRFGRFRATSRLADNADRLLNRMFDYPRYLRRVRTDFDLFHIIDHSYSHLVHELPPGRTAVTCHDLRTFRCLLEPDSEPRSRVFRMMTHKILTGLQRAFRIACVSETTRAELLRHRLARPQQAIVIPNGVASVYSPAPEICGDREAARLLGPGAGTIELLNVGDTTPRKRIDMLLRVFAAVRDRYPSLRLIRVGGSLTAGQADLAHALGVEHTIVELPFLHSRTLAAVYRRAAAVLCPSEAEGFGLPLLESMACGTPVVASDLEALREVGASVAQYAAVGDICQWTTAVLDLLGERQGDRQLSAKRRQACVERAKNFSWQKNAIRTVELYHAMLSY